MGVGGQCHIPAALPPEKTQYHSIGDWVGPRVGLGGGTKSRPCQDSIPDQFSP